MNGEKEVLIRCVAKCEVLGLTTYEDKEFDNEIHVMLYKDYKHGLRWRDRLRDIWKIIMGKSILSEDMIINKDEFKNKVRDL